MIGTSNVFPTASIRLTRFTAGPMTVKSSRSAAVKGYDDLELWLAIATKRFGRLNGLDRRGQCVFGCGTDQVGTLNWKNRKQTVANKLQDFATVISDSFGLCVKQRIQQRDYLLARVAVGAFCKSTQVGRPQDCSNFLTRTSTDLPGENFRSSIGP